MNVMMAQDGKEYHFKDIVVQFSSYWTYITLFPRYFDLSLSPGRPRADIDDDCPDGFDLFESVSHFCYLR